MNGSLESRLEEHRASLLMEWKRQQGMKGFLPQSERWGEVPGPELAFFAMPETQEQQEVWVTTTLPGYSASITGVFPGIDIVVCPHVPEKTAYLVPGEFHCRLCAEEIES